MKFSKYTALLGLGLPAVQAQLSTTCPAEGLCYSINIPERTAQSGQGDIYLQMTAPTSYAWVGLGQGSGMAGANMFIMYSNENGRNVTLSTRQGRGYVMPQYAQGPRIEMLQGTGIANNVMTANFRCSNCQSWGQRRSTMDFTASSASWIHASSPGQLRSNDVEETIQQHRSDYGPFTWEFTEGVGGNSRNPFANSTDTPKPTPSNGNNSGGGLSQEFQEKAQRRKMMLMAHGILAGSAFVVLFPLGAIIIRVLGFSGSVWLHAAMQILSYFTFVAGAGLGIYIANDLDYLTEAHPIIGLVLLALLLAQPVGGFLHHSNYKRTGGRTAISHGHIWGGRALIVLGIINGGLGLRLADNTTTGRVVYAIVAAVMSVAWAAAIAWGEWRSRRNNRDSFGMK